MWEESKVEEGDDDWIDDVALQAFVRTSDFHCSKVKASLAGLGSEVQLDPGPHTSSIKTMEV